MNLLPIKIEGPHITFVATLDDPEAAPLIETYTVTDPIIEPLLDTDGKPVTNEHGDTVLVTVGSRARDAVKSDIDRFLAEFLLLAGERELKVADVPATEAKDSAAYYDPDTKNKLTSKQARDKFEEKFPKEAAVAAVNEEAVKNG